MENNEKISKIKKDLRRLRKITHSVEVAEIFRIKVVFTDEAYFIGGQV